MTVRQPSSSLMVVTVRPRSSVMDEAARAELPRPDEDDEEEEDETLTAERLLP